MCYINSILYAHRNI